LINGSAEPRDVHLTVGSPAQAVRLVESISDWAIPPAAGAAVTRLGPGGDITLFCPPWATRLIVFKRK